MSVKTEADEKLQNAYNHISCALKNVSAVEIEHISGWDDFSAEARKRIRNALIVLSDLRDELEIFNKWGS